MFDYENLRRRIRELECKLKSMLSGEGTTSPHPSYAEHARGLEALEGPDRLDYNTLKNTPTESTGTGHDPVTVVGGGLTLLGQQLGLQISPDAQNQLQVSEAGLFVPPGTGESGPLTVTQPADRVTIDNGSGNPVAVLPVSDTRAGVVTPSTLTAIGANTLKVSANGSVTDHSDVTSAGSGRIITTTERNNLHSPTTAGNSSVSVTGQAVTLRVSTDEGNTVEVRDDGVFVPAATSTGSSRNPIDQLGVNNLVIKGKYFGSSVPVMTSVATGAYQVSNADSLDYVEFEGSNGSLNASNELEITFKNSLRRYTKATISKSNGTVQDDASLSINYRFVTSGADMVLTISGLAAFGTSGFYVVLS